MRHTSWIFSLAPLLLLTEYKFSWAFTIPGSEGRAPTSRSSSLSTPKDPTWSPWALRAERGVSGGGSGVPDKNRRILWTKKVVQGTSLVLGASVLVSLTRPVWADSDKKSRTVGYQVQKTEEEWKVALSPVQYDILRRGGTEQPGFSILEKEKRTGVFHCAGCGTPLFSSKDKLYVAPFGKG